MNTLFTLKVTLENIDPPVWRRIEVPGAMTLEDLHVVLQGVMGWHTSHLHCFEIDGKRYDFDTDDNFDWGMPHLHEAEHLLQDVARKGTRFTYLYDFGDDWYHEIVVEKVTETDDEDIEPRCLEGARACPPEDCGGPAGYEELLGVLADPRHPDQAEAREWIGAFDPDVFSASQANALLWALLALAETEREVARLTEAAENQSARRKKS